MVNELPSQKTLFVLLRSFFVALIVVDGIAFFMVLRMLRDVGVGHTERVSIYEYRFQPPEIRVSFGDTVVWENQGLKLHTVTFYGLSKILFPGENWSWKITKETFSRGENLYGDETYRDQGMEGKLIVE